MEFSKEELENKYNSLPPGLKAALDSTEVYEELQTLFKKHGLLIDRAAILEEEVSLVLLGVVPSSKFLERLRRNLDLPPEKAEEIANDVNENVFKKFREALMALRENSEEHDKEDVEAVDDLPLQKISPAEPFVEDNKLSREEILKEIERLERESVSQVSPEYQKMPINDGDSAEHLESGALDSQQEPRDVEMTTQGTVQMANEKKLDTVSAKRVVDPYREPIE